MLVRSRRVTRGLAIGLAVTMVALAGTIAFALSQQRHSAAAQRTVLTEPVERRVLVDTVATRGTVASVRESGISCMPSEAGVEARVFTRYPTVGAQLDEGDVAAAVNGRPVLLLQGKVPSFRTMLPGTSGEDVEQLQQALERLGFAVDGRGQFGPATQAAVRTLYDRAGFAAKEATPEATAELRSAEEAAEQAQQELTAAEAELAARRKGPSKADLLRAEMGVEQARIAVSEASEGPPKRVARQELEIARVELAELRRSPDIAGAQASVKVARSTRDRARSDRDTLAAATGVSIPYCEIVFVPELPVTVGATTVGAPRQPGSGDHETSSEEGENSQSWVTLAPGALVLRSDAALVDPDAVTVGTAASFQVEGSGEQSATVTSVSEKELILTPETPFAEAQRGDNYRVALTVGTTADEVLTVPVAAVAGAADGTARVTKVSEGREVDVAIRTGLTASGYVEVAPVDGSLKEGDAVVVGR